MARPPVTGIGPSRFAALLSMALALAALPAPLPARAMSDVESARARPAVASTERPATAVAIFAAGCFWCVERDFDSVPGVLETTSGYTGGKYANPTYDDVAMGLTGHVEAVRVTFDPEKVSYRQLLDFYWRHVDPTDARGQFCDRGPAYRPAIFVSSDEQQMQAEASKKDLADSKRFARPIAVEIKPAFRFWKAEEEHQDFYKKNPYRYRFYRAGCGRDARLTQLWGGDAGH